MKIKIKRLDKTLPMPKYHTKGSVAFDFYALNDEVIKPNELKMVLTNFIIKTPPGYMLMIAPRSSLSFKKGLIFLNSVGIIDQDYCGENDKLHIFVKNFTKKKVIIKRGERIAQGIFVKIASASWQEVNKMNQKSRGGWGSTGKMI
jgi:dUTP pyrophosphatase